MADQELHELQLSSKQLFFLFMCAVVVAGVIFIFGVSVGRGVRNAAGQEPQAGAADDTSVAATTPAAAPNPAELSYPQTLEGRGSDPAKVAPPAPPAEEPAGAAAAPAPPQAAASAAAPGPAAGGFIVQVEALVASDVAAREVAKLKGKGHPAFLFTAPDRTPGPRYKVHVGPFATRAEADKALRALRAEGYKPLIKR